MRRFLLAWVSVLLAGCSSELATFDDRVAPVIEAARVEANPHNVLSAQLQVLVWRGRSRATSAPMAFVTDSLPRDLPAYTGAGSNPTPGYIVLAASAYGLVIDNTGRVVWYRRFAVGPGLNFMTVQHVSADGQLTFHWSPFDHLAITDLDLSERTAPIVNWTHGNAIDLAADGKCAGTAG